MASNRPSSEVWGNFFTKLREYEGRLNELRREKHRLLNERSDFIRERQFDLVSSVDEEIRNVDRCINEILPIWYTYMGVYENRQEGAVGVHDLALRYLEQRRRPLTEIHSLLKQNVMESLFTYNPDEFDPVTYIQIKHTAFYCMKKNNYITRNPYQGIYGYLEDRHNPIKGFGEAVVIMGYRYRTGFRSYIRRHLPQGRISDQQFRQFMMTALIAVLSEFYVGAQPALPYLIVVAFTMEVIYYIRESKFILKRQLINSAIQLLWSLFCGDGFVNICGMAKLLWYGGVISRGHILASPNDQLRIHQTRYLAALPWDYLSQNTQVSHESPDSQVSIWRRYFKARNSARASTDPYRAAWEEVFAAESARAQGRLLTAARFRASERYDSVLGPPPLPPREPVMLAIQIASARLRALERETEMQARLEIAAIRMQELERAVASDIGPPPRQSVAVVSHALSTISEESIASGSSDPPPSGEPLPGCSHWGDQ